MMCHCASASPGLGVYVRTLLMPSVGVLRFSALSWPAGEIHRRPVPDALSFFESALSGSPGEGWRVTGPVVSPGVRGGCMGHATEPPRHGSTQGWTRTTADNYTCPPLTEQSAVSNPTRGRHIPAGDLPAVDPTSSHHRSTVAQHQMSSDLGNRAREG